MQLLTVEEIANIIHKWIYDKEISENFPIRNLTMYAIAREIYNAQANKVRKIEIQECER